MVMATECLPVMDMARISAKGRIRGTFMWLPLGCIAHGNGYWMRSGMGMARKSATVEYGLSSCSYLQDVMHMVMATECVPVSNRGGP